MDKILYITQVWEAYGGVESNRRALYVDDAMVGVSDSTVPSLGGLSCDAVAELMQLVYDKVQEGWEVKFDTVYVEDLQTFDIDKYLNSPVTNVYTVEVDVLGVRPKVRIESKMSLKELVGDYDELTRLTKEAVETQLLPSLLPFKIKKVTTEN